MWGQIYVRYAVGTQTTPPVNHKESARRKKKKINLGLDPFVVVDA